MHAASTQTHESSSYQMPGRRPIRLAVVSDSPPERNGVGSYYADLVAQLQDSSASAQLICPGGNNAAWHRYLPSLPGDSTQKVWFPRPIHVWRRLHALKPDAIVVPTPGPYGLLGLVAARVMHVPLIVGFHTHYEALASLYWARFFALISRAYLTGCNRLLFKHSELILANSPEMVDEAKKLGAEDAQLMGTSIPRDFFMRPSQELPDQISRIVFVGRLAEEKNIPSILAAARAMPHLSFSIAGDGPMRGTVQAAAAELTNLSYLGWVNRNQLINVIDEHDVLLLPSHVESFGTVALEGMARGRLVIVSPACGIVEWQDLSAGLLQIRTGESVTAALIRATQMTAAQRQSLASSARQAALNLNEWNMNSWTERISGLLAHDA